MILPSMILPLPNCTLQHAGPQKRSPCLTLSLRFSRARYTAPSLTPKIPLFLLLACLLSSPATLLAQFTTYSQQVEADTFVSSGQPDSNFGTLAAMQIAAPTLAQPRTLETLLRFNTAAMHAAFDTYYGPGNWVVAGVTLSLFSNVATAGQQPANGSFNKIAAGGFEIDLLSNNIWNESSITWNTLSSILPGPGNNNTLTPLGTFLWDAAGESSSAWTLDANPNLAGEIYNGDAVTILGQPTADSTVGYLFNALKLNPGYLNVTAMAVPEPSIHAPGAWTELGRPDQSCRPRRRHERCRCPRRRDFAGCAAARLRPGLPRCGRGRHSPGGWR